MMACDSFSASSRFLTLPSIYLIYLNNSNLIDLNTAKN
jgi:hypothetical protein